MKRNQRRQHARERARPLRASRSGDAGPVAASTILLALVASAATAQAPAPANSAALDRLADALEGELLPQDELPLGACPNDLARRRPAGRVLQVIENELYRWDEYALEDGSLCVRLIEPFEAVLDAERARLLLSASSLLWRRPIDDQVDAVALDPEAAAAAPIEPPSGPIEATTETVETALYGYAARTPRDTAAAAEESHRDHEAAAARIRRRQASVVGTDQRVEVGNTSSVPYQQIAYVSATWNGVGSFRATAFLVGPHLLLTNGHVVWHSGARRFPDSATVYPAVRNPSNPTAPFGSRPAARFSVENAYTHTGQPQFDYGAIFVERPFDSIRSYIPIYVNIAPAAGAALEVSGYPGVVRGQPNQVLFTHTDAVLAVQGRLLRYQVDTSGGNSGSPLLIEGSGQKRAIGVHSSGDVPPYASNVGPRFVSENEALLVEWLRWEPQERQGLDLVLQSATTQDCPQIDVFATVTNDLGDPVGGLSATNFRLWENGREARVSVAQAESIEGERNFALVLDSSGSLGDSGVAAEKTAARTFVSRLRPTDRLAVYAFESTVRKLLDFSTDRAAALAAIDQLDDLGSTALYDAIVDAANDLLAEGGQKAIVLMTDGDDTVSGSTISDATGAARNAGAPVFAAGFGSANDSVLQGIADATGGAYFRSPSAAQLEEMLRLIGEAINNAYVISWLTDFSTQDRLNLEIEARDGDEADLERGTVRLAGTRCERKGGSCSVSVQSPNGGETWRKGQNQSLRWSTSGPNCSPFVSLGLFDGAELRLLPDEPDDGVLELDPSFLPVGSAYRAVVIDLGTGELDKSDADFAVVAPFSPFPCPQDARTLCLGNGRFMARVIFRSPNGANGYGQRRDITGDTGAFWFFDAANIELTVKVLDGRPFNGFFWLFYAALSDVEYTLYVTDTQTGVTRTYFNAQGTQASRADIHYFTPVIPESEETAVVDDSDPAPSAARAEAPPATARTLHSQLDGSNDGGVNSQQYEGLEPIYDSEVADDFVVPSGKTWNVDRVEVNGFYGDGGQNVQAGPASSVNVRFYRDAGGFPGAIECGALSALPVFGLGNGSFVVDLASPCRFGAGRYWVAVQSRQNFGVAGMWFWRTRPQVAGHAAVYRNPGGYFQPPCPTWGRIDQCTNGFGRWDMTFAVSGQETSTGSNCQTTATSLCLAQSRFRVGVEYRTSQGGGNGRAVPLTGDTGYFTFFDPANVEIVLKVLDGRTLNGHFWVFYGALSDVEYTVRVEDTQTGLVKTYSNPQGNLASVGDSAALPAN